jgi:hypothetical protein
MPETPDQCLPPTIKDNPHFKRIYNNLHGNDLAELIMITGRTGMGKSDTGLYGMLNLDMGRTIKNESGWFSRFDLSKCQWIAMDLIEQITRQNPDNTQAFPKGTCFLFDEANVEASNLEFQSIKGKAIVTALQTNRKYNYCIFMTTPNYKSANIGLRRLTTAIIEMRKKIVIDGKPYARALFKWVDMDTISGMDYMKYHRSAVPTIIDFKENGEPVIMWRRKRYKSILIPLISKTLEVEYNVLKDQALKRSREDIMRQFEYYRNYLGETGLKIHKYDLVDLQKIFMSEEGVIDWKLITFNNKLYENLVEAAIVKVHPEIKGSWVKKVCNWLKMEQVKAGLIPPKGHPKSWTPM